MAHVFHEERCPRNVLLLAFIAQWKVTGPFDIVITYGERTDLQQAALYILGRTTPGRIVTQAQFARDSAHGHRAAIDCLPVREVFPMGGVKSVYLGDELELDVRAEAQRRLGIYCKLVRLAGLESGEDFPGLHDQPHAQDPAWRTLPLGPGVAAGFTPA
jgi:hypothetical protein